MGVYCEATEYTGEPNELLCQVGAYYTVIFLLINNVLMLNLVIALLSSVYTNFEDKQLGLYYEALVAVFPTLEYDNKYGAVVCAAAPMNLLIVPFWWITILPLEEEFLKKYNTFLCNILYLPIAIVFTIWFFIVTTCYVPVAYLAHSLALIKTLTNGDETMDELSEKLQRALTIVYFILAGPIVLVFSIPIDTFVFFYNLYTKPVGDPDDDKDLITDNGLEIFKNSCVECLK